LSTSKDFDVAQAFSDDVLDGDKVRVFFTVEGKNGVDIENISAYGLSFNPDYSESEILFKSKSPFSVTGFVEKTDSKGKYYEIKLTE
jgi:hypothetical protein